MTCPNVRGDTTQYCTLNCDHGDLRDERDALAAVVAAVHTALDQRDKDRTTWMAAIADEACVSAIAKAVRR